MLRTGFYFPAPGRVGPRPTEEQLRALWAERKADVLAGWAALKWSAEDSWAEQAFDKGDLKALFRLEWRRIQGTEC